jgi:polar amino acid transport system permease protein
MEGLNWCEIPGYLLGSDNIQTYGCRIFGGLGMTLYLVAISVSVGFALGLLIALARLSPSRWLQWPARAWITFFRGTPLLVQLFLIYYGAGQARPFFESIGLWWFFRDAVYCCLFAFTVNTAAYQAEALRGAIQSVAKGQWEAAAVLGLSKPLAFVKIVLPQALMVALRPLGNELIIMIKASAIASLVTVMDLMGTTRLAFARSFDLTVYIFAAALYLIMVETIRRVWDRMERRLTRHLTIAH